MAGYGSIHHTISEAIRTRHTLMYSPRGEARIVEPPQYGVTRDGDHVLVSWRWEIEGTAGEPATESGPNEPGAWERVRLDEMHAVRMLDKAFETPRLGYRRGNKAMHRIHTEL